MPDLCVYALDILNTAPANEKAMKTRDHAANWFAGNISSIGHTNNAPKHPARLDKPELLHHTKMPKRRKAGSPKSKIALLHALAHIELNAIDLAWDIIARFSYLSIDNNKQGFQGFTLPKEFFDDWVKVADDEAKHFLMINDRLNDLGASYGDLPAHDGLWQSSEKTAHEFPARLAIIPMVLEARGLDVTPGMIDLMQKQDDDKTARMLQIILEDEITHVRAGTRWFESWCAHHDLDVEVFWQSLVRKYFGATLKRPFNHPSREEAGMIRDWYEPLADIEFKVNLLADDTVK